MLDVIKRLLLYIDKHGHVVEELADFHHAFLDALHAISLLLNVIDRINEVNVVRQSELEDASGASLLGIQ